MKPWPVRHAGRAISIVAAIGLLSAACAAQVLRGTALDDELPAIVDLGHGLSVISAHELHGPRLGGVSAVTGSADELILFSDRGDVWQVGVERAADGQISQLAPWQELDLPELPMPYLDVESATATADGIALAFERNHAITELRVENGQLAFDDRITQHGDLDVLPINGGIEAMASIDNHWLLIAEQAYAADGNAQAFWVKNGEFVTASYAVADGFSATAADATSSHLIILERSLSLLAGWRARLSIVPLERLQPGSDQPIVPQRSWVIPASVPVDNMEALKAIERRDGLLELLLLSDDNFNVLQRNLLLQMTLDVSGL